MQKAKAKHNYRITKKSQCEPTNELQLENNDVYTKKINQWVTNVIV